MLYEDNFNFSRCNNLLFKEIFHKGEQKKKHVLDCMNMKWTKHKIIWLVFFSEVILYLKRNLHRRFKDTIISFETKFYPIYLKGVFFHVCNRNPYVNDYLFYLFWLCYIKIGPDRSVRPNTDFTAL